MTVFWLTFVRTWEGGVIKLLKNLLLVLIMFCFVGNVYAGSASAKLVSLADSLLKGYSDKFGQKKNIIAIFPLNCDEKLEKQRIGFAVSEIMSHKFVASKIFTVVERGELSKLLTEQKLQASGAVESETAVKLGKILGAGVILVGNVQKVGGKYQVNTRLVSAETSAVLSSGYEELNSSAFEDDARVYLSIVPEEQTLGIYAIYNYRKNQNIKATYTQPDQPDGVITPRAFSSNLVGGGLLYRPAKHIQLNAEYTTSTGEVYATVTSTAPFPYNRSAALKMSTVSFMASYVSRFWSRWGYLVGLGVQGINIGFDRIKIKENPPMGLFVKSGIEFKPQSRIGLGVNLKYDLRKVEASSQYDNKVLKLNPLSFESTLTLYF